ncbi:MAG: glycosyltransferase family 4 protein [Candidatus Kariarchaeaceae archaeon]|jgi:glycosyltransferase involved in cell wall biosynthesis
MKIFYQIPYPRVHNQHLEIVSSYPKELELIFPQPENQNKIDLRMASKVTGISYGTYNGSQNVDLLHLVDRLGFKPKVPWITEFGDSAALMRYDGRKIHSKIFKYFFKKAISNKKFVKFVPKSKIIVKPLIDNNLISDERIETVYPAIKTNIKKIHENKDEINLIFNIGSSPLFIWKGGLELIGAFRKLKNEYPKLTLTIIGEVKTDIKQIDGLILTQKIPRELLIKKYYPEADILVHPTHMDSFGYVLLEAKAFGLPIVSTTHYAIPEIIEHNKQGFLIKDIKNTWYNDQIIGFYGYQKWKEPRFLPGERVRLESELFSALSKLIEDHSLRKRFGEANFKEVTEGKFSFKHRNQQILEIYKNATDFI